MHSGIREDRPAGFARLFGGRQLVHALWHTVSFPRGKFPPSNQTPKNGSTPVCSGHKSGSAGEPFFSNPDEAFRLGLERFSAGANLSASLRIRRRRARRSGALSRATCRD